MTCVKKKKKDEGIKLRHTPEVKKKNKNNVIITEQNCGLYLLFLIFCIK